jgi:hypothetical protein
MTWYKLPFTVPDNEEIVWIGVKYYYGTPFKAQWDDTNKLFTSEISSIMYPAWAVARWGRES